ncbi:hypothetical protein VNO77_21108 [Canavalia gladiata]|uniref:Acyl carrier protein n=1 Tax=Canavalia gladiata TaxID=3824 RepID=A0AAN9LRC9_CANGL
MLLLLRSKEDLGRRKIKLWEVPTNSHILAHVTLSLSHSPVLRPQTAHTEREREREMALRAAILRHVRVPPQAAPKPQPWRGFLRSMSSHDDHLSKEEVIERVLAVVKDFPKVDPSKVTPDVHFQKDLGLDSLDTVEIVMALEEEFKLEIPDKEADKIDSCHLAIEYISNHPMAG